MEDNIFGLIHPKSGIDMDLDLGPNSDLDPDNITLGQIVAFYSKLDQVTVLYSKSGIHVKIWIQSISGSRLQEIRPNDGISQQVRPDNST
jgi:hypothetical protein